MTDVPAEFLRRLTEHNRNCWFAAVLSLLGSWLAWVLLFALYTAASLLFETIRTGNVDIMSPPGWYGPVGLAVVAAALLLGAIYRWRRRYQPSVDRPIIGWHLLPEVLLLPARMTFSIADHIAARIVLKKEEKQDAWCLLQAIHRLGRAELSTLTAEIPNQRRLNRLILALQLTNWIDLHRGERDWFYRVRSDQEEELREMEGGEGKMGGSN